jgi:hypothetical protein
MNECTSVGRYLFGEDLNKLKTKLHWETGINE